MKPKPAQPTTVNDTDPTDAILVLLDVVGYTPQARAAGAHETQRFDRHLAEELQERAEPRGFQFIKSVGDAALLWGNDPAGLVKLILDLYHRNPIPAHGGITPGLRMLAHKDWFVFSRDAKGNVVDVHGLEGIVLFRLEKAAHLNRVLVTPHLFNGLRHLCAPNAIEFRAIELPEELKGVEPDSPRQVFLLTPPLAGQTLDLELPGPYRAARALLRERVQTIPVFGQLYEPIPMAENFLNLTLDRQRTQTRGGYYFWSAPDLKRQWELREPLEKRRPAFNPDHLSADELFVLFPAAVIAGLPGAGKTTILRHFA